jgi:hypothetical protein
MSLYPIEEWQTQCAHMEEIPEEPEEEMSPIDFSCRVCGKECPTAPEPPERAVCEDHCPDHEYTYDSSQRKHVCKHCDAWRPDDW